MTTILITWAVIALLFGAVFYRLCPPRGPEWWAWAALSAAWPLLLVWFVWAVFVRKDEELVEF